MKRLLLAAIAAAGLGSSADAAEIVRHRGAPNAPILSGVTVPADATYLYLSGQVPSPVGSGQSQDAATYGDTKTQAVSVFGKIDALLKAQGYALGDVIKLTVFLVGDPKLSGKLDFQGFQEAYGQFFGTAEQPNIVARSTVQVAALANPAYLVEIEATAAKAR